VTARLLLSENRCKMGLHTKRPSRLNRQSCTNPNIVKATGYTSNKNWNMFCPKMCLPTCTSAGGPRRRAPTELVKPRRPASSKTNAQGKSLARGTQVPMSWRRLRLAISSSTDA